MGGVGEREMEEIECLLFKGLGPDVVVSSWQ